MNNKYPISEEQVILTPAEEDLIDRTADEILDRYREAFEELAK